MYSKSKKCDYVRAKKKKTWFAKLCIGSFWMMLPVPVLVIDTVIFRTVQVPYLSQH
jgi:hypothetical protein